MVIEGKMPEEHVQYPLPIAMGPENIMIVVAGGEQSGHAYLMQVSLSGEVASKEIMIPGNWDKLLDEAEEDLGPLPLW